MDFLNEYDRKFSDFEEGDMSDMMGPDAFNTSNMVEDSFMPLPALDQSDNEWFNSIFDEPGLVYNDKNLGEAATQPCIKSEHSYSANNLSPSSPLALTKIEESDTAMFHTDSSALDLTQKATLIQAAATASSATLSPEVKQELLDTDPLLTAMTSDPAPLTPRPATIILATTTTSAVSTASSSLAHSMQSAFSGNAAMVEIKTEPMETYDETGDVNVDSMMMPPTPPSSAGSDSDGSQSPQRSAPNSPARQSPMPTSGVLILTEEEKRTLISEGYPVPAKLPLTKQEEKNLKKVRRKIKNKISAQESRRKKKEYLEALEKRVESFNHENCDLKKKVESLENNNRTLMGQLAKLQAAIAKVPRTAAASATQTGTALMVLVLCFAVFLGGSGSGSGSASLNVGYRSPGAGFRVPLSAALPPGLSFAQPGPLRPQPNMGPAGPVRAAHTPQGNNADDDAYSTPNLKSRVLMAVSEEDYDDYRPTVPWSWDDQSCHAAPEAPPSAQPTRPNHNDAAPIVEIATETDQPRQEKAPAAVVTVAVGSESNGTAERNPEYQAMMHPDIAVAPALKTLGNFSAELETA